MTSTLNKTLSLFIVILLCFVAGCTENFPDNPNVNQPPKTFVSIFSENDLNAGISRQTFNWWGDDPDGIVAGFIYTFNPAAPNLLEWHDNSSSTDWTFTTATRQVFNLRLAGTDTVFTFWVKAVDDVGAADPDGATQDFPVINTRPVVEFPTGTDVPPTTFTVAEFVWVGTDLDGNDTISNFQYVLDDTTNESAWVNVSPNVNSVLLTAADGLTGGEHVFYLRAIDLAGATSSIVRMPRETNEVWVVREPTSDFLIIDDYNIADNTAAFYQSTLEAIVGPADVWDIKSNGAELEPPTGRAFFQTLMLFKRVFWYADSSPNLEKAQVALPDYIDGGGKILMTTNFMEFASNQGDPVDFSPADSLGPRIARITRNQLVSPTQDFAAMGFPDLQVNTAIIPNVFPVVPKVSSNIIYLLPESTQWPGTPPMALIDSQQTFVFFGLPMASLNGQSSVGPLLQIIFNQILTE
jgi:hypothetical protein